MMVSTKAIEALDKHWAISSIPGVTRERAFEISKLRLVRQALGGLLAVTSAEDSDADSILERVALAYELAAIESVEALLNPARGGEYEGQEQQAMAGAFRAYELLQSCRVPREDEVRVFHVLHLAAVAYCGDRWPDLRRWMRDNPESVAVPSVAKAGWERRILFRLFECWIRLFRKRDWDDVDRVRETVAGLREDQSAFEKVELAKPTPQETQVSALRLVALYHWAKATEILAIYTLQGEPPNVRSELDQHFERARSFAARSGDAALEVLLRWLHVAASRMVAGSIWWVARAVNSRVTRFVASVTKAKGMFELLPPQRAAIQEQGLLDQASRAIVVDLPTSGGKTALAQFRMLQALNQFDAENGWVAYLAPTRALVSQIARRLRTDFGPLNIRVEQLSGAVEIDGFEEGLLVDDRPEAPFDILVATPEKLHLVIRNKKISRPLALLVMDEAQNIEDEERGLRIELLLATVKRDCPSANFLLLMPFVPNAPDLAKWLGAETGRTISLGTTPWQPNKRAIGIFGKERSDTGRGDWRLWFETLITPPKTLELRGVQHVGRVRPLKVSHGAAGLSIQAGAMAKVFSERGTSIAIAQQIPHVWSMAKAVAKNLPQLDPIPDEIGLVRRFLETEIGEDFLLVELLNHGVGVHHAGLSDEARSLVEWLTEIGALKVLCATTTIAQGINFPVGSVFLASRHFPYGHEMPTRAFWNLAGRAGRMDQESIGVVGIAAGDDPDAVRQFVSTATGDLISRLVKMLSDIESAGRLSDLETIIDEPQWSAFRCYVAHLWNEKKSLDSVLAETEQLLRNTYGFSVLRGAGLDIETQKADALLRATGAYARRLAQHPENASLADLTGFAPEGVASALIGLNRLTEKLRPQDWEPTSLFGDSSASALPSLYGVLMNIPEIGKALREIGSHGLTQQRFSDLTKAWVNGDSIARIASEFFAGRTKTETLSNACKAIFRVLTNSGCWGLAALTKMPTSGLDFNNLSLDQKRKINNLPAMIYHGVKTEAAVLMRMNSVPRSIAELLGGELERATKQLAGLHNVATARQFLRSLDVATWDALTPVGSPMSGADYQSVWQRLSGETLLRSTAGPPEPTG